MKNCLESFACTRQEGFRRFDAYDKEIGVDFAARAAMFIDNARRYSREHATALTLQRSMLPTGLSYPSSVEVRHRYLPGSKLIEVGGDWYESIALPGAGSRSWSATWLGTACAPPSPSARLRTAIHTLAMLELPPADSLQQLDELMHTPVASRAEAWAAPLRSRMLALITAAPCPGPGSLRGPARR